MPAYLCILREYFPNLKVIVTQSAENFISKEALAFLVPEVHSGLFPLSEKKKNHIELAKWADVLIVLPATAQVIAQSAHGLSNTLLTLTILAHPNPVLFFPNMHLHMWENPATQKNISLLREYGHQVVVPSNEVTYSSGKKMTDLSISPPDQIIAAIHSEVERRKNAKQFVEQ